MKVWLSHPTGNSVVRALLAGFNAAHWNYSYFSTLALSSDETWARFLPETLRSELSRRTYNIPRNRLSRRPSRESIRLIVEKLRRRSLAEDNPLSTYSVYRDLDQVVARRLMAGREAPDVIYAFEDGAAESFRTARDKGVHCVYDLPIAYWETSRKILADEALRLPEWEPTLGATRDSDAKLARKTEETQLADTVICPSRFVFNSLPSAIHEKAQCVIIPFGSPPIFDVPHRKSEKLRVLFAGAMTQRKGLADVFAAFKQLRRRDVELVVMGAPVSPMSFYRAAFPGFTHEPPRNHRAVLDLMRTCDLLVLPSLVEGRALVQHEALACGLPLIVTENAGAEDMVAEGETGFLVPTRSPESIAEKIDWFASHRADLEQMRECCRAKAREYSWDAYVAKIKEVIVPESQLACP